MEAHHVRVKDGGVGLKSSDFDAVPLHADLHREYHDLGRAAFELKYGVNLEDVIRKMQQAFSRLPQKRVVKRTEQPRIRRIEVTCICIRRVHRLAPSKVQGKRFQCPVTGEWVKAA